MLLSVLATIPAVSVRLAGAEVLSPAQLKAEEIRLRRAHTPKQNAVMEDLFRPCTGERAAVQAKLRAGALPADLPRGAVLKNGPNARWGSSDPGDGGWLDGDGLVHAVILPPDEGIPLYSRAWVRTAAFEKEERAQRPLFSGSLVAPFGLRLLGNLAKNAIRAFQPQKDTANTGLVRLSGGRCLALMEQCLPSVIRLGRDGRLVTEQAECDLDGCLVDIQRFPLSRGALTAHFKTDAGGSVGVTYCASGTPGVRVDVLHSNGVIGASSLIEFAGGAQTMVHDCAITSPAPAGGDEACAGYVLILDMPMTVRPERMIFDRFPIEYEPTNGARIGLLPRDAIGAPRAQEATVWIDVDPCVVLHTVNAYQDPLDATIRLTALRSTPESPTSFIGSYTAAYLYEWVLDPASRRCVSERCLSPLPVEFPSLDPRLIGKRARYGYAIAPCSIGGPNRHGPPSEGILIDAVVKFDLENGNVASQWQTPEGWWLTSEPTFVPRITDDDPKPTTEGDDGYLLVFCTRSAAGEKGTENNSRNRESTGGIMAEQEDGRTSRLFVLDASSATPDEHQGTRMEAVAEFDLGEAVPYGLHSLWIPYEELQ